MTSSPQIGKEQINLLERLSNACAVSGDEGEVRSIVLEQVKPYAGEVKVDAMGNVLVTRWAASQHAPRVMLAAHMDEVGFMLVEKEEGGLFSFQKVGGIDERQLAGKPVWVGKKHIPGVIGARPIHIPIETSEAEDSVGESAHRPGPQRWRRGKARRPGHLCYHFPVDGPQPARQGAG